MARVGTPNLGLGTWLDSENPGAGSQAIDSTGLNGNWIKLDTAVGVGHNPDGSHKTNIIDKGNCKTTIADASTIELHATNGLQIKDAGIPAAKLGAACVETAKIKDDNVTAAKLAPGAIAVGGDAIAAGALKAADFGASAVETAAIKDLNVTSEKLEYLELFGILNQASTGAPVLTIIHNTLSETPVASRYDTGTYYLTCTGNVFTTGKTFCGLLNNYTGFVRVMWNSQTGLIIETKNTSGSAADSILSSNAIIIRVYP